MEIALSCLLLWLSSFLNIGFHSNPREAVFAVRITFVSGGGGGVGGGGDGVLRALPWNSHVLFL